MNEVKHAAIFAKVIRESWATGDVRVATPMPTEFEDEQTWLRHRIVRMRTLLRFAKDPRTETGLRDLIGEAEARLEALEARRNTK